jgi:hypothetical protein
MADRTLYRGGRSLVARPHEVRLDPATGLLRTTYGVSVFDQPDNLDRFGGAHQVANVPESLQVVQRGRNPHHYEIVPAAPMTLDEYQQALDQIVLVPV